MQQTERSHTVLQMWYVQVGVQRVTCGTWPSRCLAGNPYKQGSLWVPSSNAHLADDRRMIATRYVEAQGHNGAHREQT